MTKKTRRIITLSLIGALIIAITVSIVLIVNEVNRNPLLGTWHAADKTLSYQFFEDGTVKATYSDIKLPVIETKYNGTIDGTYAYDKSEKELSVTLNIYSKEITTHYTFETDESTLTLTDTSTNKAKNYILEVIPE